MAKKYILGGTVHFSDPIWSDKKNQFNKFGLSGQKKHLGSSITKKKVFTAACSNAVDGQNIEELNRNQMQVFDRLEISIFVNVVLR